jgi:purine-binding chemotaxis protein CheW
MGLDAQGGSVLADLREGQRAQKEAASDLVQMLVFKLAAEEYVLDIMRVNEIIRPESITPVRKAPDYVRGVIELRGSIVPILDLRRRLGLPDRPTVIEPYVVIVTVEGVVVGLEVDSVVEVVRVERSSIKASPDLTVEVGETPFFLGIVKQDHRLLMLLNIKRLVLSRDQVTPESWVDRARLQREGV